MTTQQPTKNTVLASAKLQRKIVATIAKKTFCTLATTSPAGRSHSAGVVYESVDGTLWVHSLRGSRKVRSIEDNPHVGVCIPYRRLPFGPPFTIHFQATAEVFDMDHPEPQKLIDRGFLRSIAGHGALDMSDGCFIAIGPRGNVHSYGPGARTLDLIRDPLNNGASSFRLDEVVAL
jgi:hypothetical protein